MGPITTGEVVDASAVGRVTSDGAVVSMGSSAADVATAASSVPAVSVVVIGNAADVNRVVAVGEGRVA